MRQAQAYTARVAGRAASASVSPTGSDSEITRFADAEDGVVVTKDSDFRHTHETGGHPARLLLISIGNVRNQGLLALVSARHDESMRALDQADFVEFGTKALTLHPRRVTDESRPRRFSA